MVLFQSEDGCGGLLRRRVRRQGLDQQGAPELRPDPNKGRNGGTGDRYEKPEVGTKKPEVGTEKLEEGTQEPQVGTEEPEVGTEKPEVEI